jgi:hypothetical protein
VYERRSVLGYFQYKCKLLPNDEKTLYEIYKEYPSIFTRYYKILKRIVYEQDRFKKRTKPEVTWFFGAPGHGQIEWADRYLNSCEIITKVANYYLSFIGDKNIIYDKFHTNEKYFHLLQMFIDNHHLPENNNMGYKKSL